MPLNQQKFLVVSVLSNLPWLPRNWKNVRNETTKPPMAIILRCQMELVHC